MSESFLNDRVTLWPGDCLDVLAHLEENSVDSVVTDPPYHLTSIVKRFGAENAAPAKSGKTGAYKRASAGFMGKQWDGGEIAFDPETWAAVMRVLKPGGHLLAFGAPKNFGFMQYAIAQSGFEVRDVLCWLFGSGFPKSHDVSKGIDRARKDNEDWQRVGAWLKERRVGAGHETRRSLAPMLPGYKNLESAAADLSNWENGLSFPTLETWALLKQLLSLPDEMDAEVWRLNGRKGQPSEEYASRPDAEYESSVGMRESWTDGRGWNGNNSKGGDPVRDSAREWQGWGTALKPAYEPIILARKPLSEGTVAANVLKWGVGALNIDGCRVATDDGLGRPTGSGAFGIINDDGWVPTLERTAGSPLGRWPANVLHDGSDEVVGAFPDLGRTAGGYERSTVGATKADGWGHKDPQAAKGFGDEGSAARFFYSAKADSDDRLGSKHPTVKPLDLMQYLVRLVTPPRGIVLDLFAGTGTTAEAAWREGMRAILIEREEEYCNDIRRRMALCLSGPAERKRESIKARSPDKPFEEGTLFA